jgi:hypothetical protein
VFGDPCLTAGGPLDPPVAHTVDGILAGLADMRRVDATDIKPADINGQPAKSIELTNTVDTDTTRCTDDRLLWLWTLPGGSKGPGTNGGATEHIWAFDLDGAVVLFDGETYPQTLRVDREQFDEMADTVVFE